MKTTLLSDKEFKATIEDPQKIGVATVGSGYNDYLKDIPAEDFQGIQFTKWEPHSSYLMEAKHTQHILYPSLNKNIFLVLVSNSDSGEIIGHHLLSLNKHYGLDGR